MWSFEVTGSQEQGRCHIRKGINGRVEKNTFSGESANREFGKIWFPKESGHSCGVQDIRRFVKSRLICKNVKWTVSSAAKNTGDSVNLTS